MEGVISDYDLALQLHLEMNDNQAPRLDNFRDELQESNFAGATAQSGNSSRGDIVDLSDSLGEASVVVKKRKRSRSPLQKVKTEVEVENQEAITVREKSEGEDQISNQFQPQLLDQEGKDVAQGLLHAAYEHLHRLRLQSGMGRGEHGVESAADV